MPRTFLLAGAFPAASAAAALLRFAWVLSFFGGLTPLASP